MVMLSLTAYSVNRIKRNTERKKEFGYNFDKNDWDKFENTWEVMKLCFFCFIAAILCSCTGIAGGMVLGPLFLTYNMIPSVMSGTNQYITLVASMSVCLQFLMAKNMLVNYALCFGSMTIVCAYIGISSVNSIVKKSGKQSVITVILAACLIIALLSLPLKFLLLNKTAHSGTDVTAKTSTETKS